MASKSKSYRPHSTQPYQIPVGLLPIGVALMKSLLRHLRDPKIVAIAWVFSKPADHSNAPVAHFERHVLAAIGLSLRTALMWAEASIRTPRKSNAASSAIYYAKRLSKLVADAMIANEDFLRSRYPEIGEEIGKEVLEAANAQRGWDMVMVERRNRAPMDPLLELQVTLHKGAKQANSQSLNSLNAILKKAESDVIAMRTAKPS